MKIVINADYGGFHMSHAAIKRYNELASTNLDLNDGGVLLKRTDPFLIQTVEELGERESHISGKDYCGILRVVEIPDDCNWEIDEFDGAEKIVDKDRVWS